MVRSLVTGGLGFIGSHLVDFLVLEGHEVVVLDNCATGSEDNENPKAEYHTADITDFEAIRKHFDGVDYVFHVAALPRILPSFEDPYRFLLANVGGTVNCLRAAKEAKVKRFIFSSSSAVYGNKFRLPTDETNEIELLSPYGVQKYESELYCRLFSDTYGLEVVALRYFNVYGPRSLNPNDPYSAYSSPIMIFIRQRLAGKPLTVTWDGEQRRDYIFVADVARANLLAATMPLPSKHEIFNIGSGENHTVNEIASTIGGERTYLPKRNGEARITLSDVSKAKRLLGWQPSVTFTEGVRRCKAVEGLR